MIKTRNVIEILSGNYVGHGTQIAQGLVSGRNINVSQTYYIHFYSAYNDVEDGRACDSLKF